MYIYKRFNLKGLLITGGAHIIWIALWMSVVAVVYHYTKTEWMVIPWLPISLIGTAVAFYVGFKNNQSYDRVWEARKIWGAIVNSSRSWGITVKGFVSDQFRDASEKELKAFHEELIYRHIAWLYQLREQLLVPTPWEHINQGRHIQRATQRRMTTFGLGSLDGDIKSVLKLFLSEKEVVDLERYKNGATHLIDVQSAQLKQLRKYNLIDDFRHMELQKILNDFYIHQGKAERIKKFPLPRQYANISTIFVGWFIFLLPFGMLSQFLELGGYGYWLLIPFSSIVAWVFLMMELVGDYSENPFEGLENDIPMLSLCRTIEIDLRQMLGEEDLPRPIEAKNGVLM